MSSYNVKTTTHAARPRNRRYLDAIYGTENPVVGTSPGYSAPSYWNLESEDKEGVELDEPRIYAPYPIRFDKYMESNGFRFVFEENAVRLERVDGEKADFCATGSVSAFGLSDTPAPDPGGGGLDGVGEDGSGNAYTGFTYVENVLTLIKGTSFATQSELTSHVGNSTLHLTSTERSNWNTAYTQAHTHSNKSVLDGITSTNINNWNTAYSYYHTHSNKSVLDGITSTNINNWNSAYTQAHTHSNKSYLDVINQNLGTGYSPSFSGIYIGTGTSRAYLSIVSGALRISNASGNAIDVYSMGGLSSLAYSSTATEYITNNVTNKPMNIVDTSGQTAVYIYGNVINAQSIGSANLWINYWTGNRSDGYYTSPYSHRTLLVGGKTQGTAILAVNNNNSGNVTVNGSVVQTSDERLKDRICDLEGVLDKIRNIQPFYYTRKNDKDKVRFLGLSAQDIERIFPEFISRSAMFEGEEEYLSLSYSELGAVVSIQASRELLVRVEKLEKENKKLQNLLKNAS